MHDTRKIIIGILCGAGGVGLDMAGNMLSSYWPDAPHWLFGLLFWGGIVIAICSFGYVGVEYFFLSKKRDGPNLRLADECELLAKEIEEFVHDRDAGSPRHFPDNMEELHDTESQYRRLVIHSDYSSATDSLYSKKFNGRLCALVEELKERGHIVAHILTFGFDCWSDKKIGKLRNYSRILREGGMINDVDR